MWHLRLKGLIVLSHLFLSISCTCLRARSPQWCPEPIWTLAEQSSKGKNIRTRRHQLSSLVSFSPAGWLQ